MSKKLTELQVKNAKPSAAKYTMAAGGGLTLRADFSELTSRGGDTQVDHTAIIVALIGEFYRMGQFISPYRTARNNAFKMLRTEKNFPRGIKTLDQLAPVLVDAQRRGLLEIEDYRTKDRKAGERWKVAFAPSAPSAPTSSRITGMRCSFLPGRVIISSSHFKFHGSGW